MAMSPQEVESFAKSAWPHVARVSVDQIVPGRRKPNEFEPLESGFTLTAYDAAGAYCEADQRGKPRNHEG